MILSKLTGWGLDETLDLEVEDLLAWVKTAQKIEEEIAKKAKSKRG